MSALLGELTVAGGLAVAVLASAASVGGRDRQVAVGVALETRAREGAEGLLELVAASPPQPGRHDVPLTALPVTARLPGARAQADVTEAGPGLRRIVLTLRWTVAGHTRALQVATTVRIGG